MAAIVSIGIELVSILPVIGPIWKSVFSLVKGDQSSLRPEERNALENELNKISSKLEDISEEINLKEVRGNYGPLEDRIKYQYKAFIEAAQKAYKNPDNVKSYMEEFKEIYVEQKQNESLDALYRGLTGQPSAFGTHVLKVYQKSYNGDHDKMKKICSYYMRLIEMGLAAHMGYTAATLDDVAAEEKKWSEKINEIQQEMEKVLKEKEDEDMSS